MTTILATLAVGIIGAYGLYKLDRAIDAHLQRQLDEESGFYLLEAEQDQFH